MATEARAYVTHNTAPPMSKLPAYAWVLMDPTGGLDLHGLIDTIWYQHVIATNWHVPWRYCYQCVFQFVKHMLVGVFDEVTSFHNTSSAPH